MRKSGHTADGMRWYSEYSHGYSEYSHWYSEYSHSRRRASSAAGRRARRQRHSGTTQPPADRSQAITGMSWLHLRPLWLRSHCAGLGRSWLRRAQLQLLHELRLLLRGVARHVRLDLLRRDLRRLAAGHHSLELLRRDLRDLLQRLDLLEHSDLPARSYIYMQSML